MPLSRTLGASLDQRWRFWRCYCGRRSSEPLLPVTILVCKDSFRFGVETTIQGRLPSLPYLRMFPASVISQETQVGLSSVSVGKEGPWHTMARTVVQGPDPHAPNSHTRPPAFNPGASAASLSGRQEGCTVCGSLRQERWGGGRGEDIVNPIPSLPDSCRAGIW